MRCYAIFSTAFALALMRVKKTAAPPISALKDGELYFGVLVVWALKELEDCDVIPP